MTSITITHVDTNGAKHTRRFHDTIIHPSGGAPTPRTAEQQADEYIRLRSESGFPGLVGKTVE